MHVCLDLQSFIASLRDRMTETQEWKTREETSRTICVRENYVVELPHFCACGLWMAFGPPLTT